MTSAVRVTAADFNGRDWDGSPFAGGPQSVEDEIDWIVDALKSGDLSVHPSSTDYAVWKVRTPKGDVLAWPGDWIERTGGGLFVRNESGKPSEVRPV